MLHIVKIERDAQCSSCGELVKKSYVLSLPIGKIPLCENCYEQLKTEIEFLDIEIE